MSLFSFSHLAPRPAQPEQRPASADFRATLESLRADSLRGQIERARPASAALTAILGHGVSPAALAARLAIEIEDAGMFRDRAERIGAFALLLAEAAESLAHEARARIARDSGAPIIRKKGEAR